MERYERARKGRERARQGGGVETKQLLVVKADHQTEVQKETLSQSRRCGRRETGTRKGEIDSSVFGIVEDV